MERGEESGRECDFRTGIEARISLALPVQDWPDRAIGAALNDHTHARRADMTIAVAAIAAVSARRIVGPSDAEIHPAC